MNQYIVSNQKIFQQIKLSLSETMKTTKITRKRKLITLLPINITSTKTKVQRELDDLLILTWTNLTKQSRVWFRKENGLYAFI